jgi:hypothetical protein
MDPKQLATQLNQYVLESLGVATPLLAPRWATANPTPNGIGATLPLTLTFGSPWYAPFSGILSYSPNASAQVADGTTEVYSGSTQAFNFDGSLVKGPLMTLALHPHAYVRLQDLYATRFGSDGATPAHSVRPVPAMLVVRLSAPPNPIPDGISLVDFGDPTNPLPAGVASFHDANGLQIDALAVASAFTDLLKTYVALGPPGFTAASLTGAGGYVDGIAALGATPARYVHVVDPHLGPWQDPGSGHGLVVSSGGTPTRITDAEPVEFPDGASIQAEDTSSTQMLRWGLATYGKLGKAALPVPALSGGTLARDFLRVMAVPLDRFLLGNRSASLVDGIPGADRGSVAEPAPLVREGSAVRFCTDGIAVLGEVNGVLEQVSSSMSDYLVYMVSPAISDSFDVPKDTTAASRWGQATSADITPAPGTTPGDWNPATAPAIRAGQQTASGQPGITAAWNSPTGVDVLVTIAPGLAPAGAHVRVYNRIFYTGPSLEQSATLFRGDGGAIIAGPSAKPVQILLTDPLSLGKAGQIPNAILHFDLHVLPNLGAKSRERIFGGYSVPVGGFGTTFTLPVSKNNFSVAPANRRGICTSPIMGLYPSGSFNLAQAISDTTPGQIIQLFLQLAGLSSSTAATATPREGVRVPTMARYESIVALGVPASGAGRWEAVLSGGWLLPESHVERYHQGNPGGPAGPETSVCGVYAGDQLGYDLALAANRRANDLLSRLEDLDNAIFAAPPAPASPTTIAGAVLQTVAKRVETPEFSLLPESDLATLPNTFAGLLQAIQDNINLPLPGLSGGNYTNPDRIVAEVKREFYASAYGRRDWQWSLEYALGHARELIYWETQCLTANPGTQLYSYDVVGALVTRLKAEPTLKLILVSPKKLPFGTPYAAWAQYFYQARNAAWAQLQAAAPGRVLAVHPIGFPGRPLNVRTSVAIIDDAWCSVGTAVPRRRGLSFDGSIDTALMDGQIADGRGTAIRNFRRSLMANVLGAQAPSSGATPATDWVRLGQLHSAFTAFNELVQQGGRGLVEPQLWAGPDPGMILAQSAAIADPDGRDTDTLLPAIAALAAADTLESGPS